MNAEESVTGMIAKAYSGETDGSGSGVATKAEEKVEKFEFDADFQTRVASLVMRDGNFMRQVRHLIRPEYFEDIAEASLVSMACRYWDKYKVSPTTPVLAQLIKDDIHAKIVRADLVSLIKPKLKELLQADLRDRDYVAEKVAEFVRHQAVSQAVLASVDLIGRGQFEKIETSIKTAVEIGVNRDGDAYDYWARIDERTEHRIDKAAGKLPPRGITTGHRQLDELLYHLGWGRGELATIMGGPKSGKTAFLLNAAKMASLAGFNVLYVTLEVSADILSQRLDASVSGNTMDSLDKCIRDIESQVKGLRPRAGRLVIHDYPTGTFSPAMLDALIERYKGEGLLFDLAVMDYADIMKPSHRTDDSIENSKSIYVDLRAIMVRNDMAGLTGTQTNRAGFTSAVSKMEHVSDDINKMRIVDLAISINITDEERARNECRLYFAASRNQASGFTVFVQQDIARMRFIESIIRVE